MAFFDFHKIATIIKANPLMLTIGAKVMRRKLKISGLNSNVVEEPCIRKKPTTISTNAIAISIKLIFLNAKFPILFD